MKDTASGLIAVDRTVRVLQAVSRTERPHLAEVARQAGLNEATALRYLTTLAGLGFVEKVDGRHYRLGWEVFRLGQRALLDHVPRDAIRPVVEDLVAAYNETVNFAWRKDDAVVLIDVAEGNRAVKKVSDVGQIDPWHASALGKALMSTMTDDAWHDLVGTGPLPRFTPHTITSLDRLAAEIERARTDGYAVDHEEADEDLTCIAAPVPAPTGPSHYAISVSFLTHRLDESTIGDVGARVRDAADRIATRLY
ncbi:IclR family transcriptional regulator [Nocardioides sp. C4-1]|uniref:IclR family transcriptional regulator n=1 Tax=Nocardioides sp. C4-1 TaxID=3151851 RepID=UPI0032670896